MTMEERICERDEF